MSKAKAKLRPRLLPRERFIGFRASAGEADAIREAAYRIGLTASGLMRMVIFERLAAPKPVVLGRS
mgnify:FL=1